MLRHRTDQTYQVVRYLFLVAISKRKRKERTLRAISKAAGVNYWSTRNIAWRLQEDCCIVVNPEKYEFSEANYFTPHTIVSIEDKSCIKQLAEKLRWFRKRRK